MRNLHEKLRQTQKEKDRLKDGSFQRIFWEQQAEAASRNDNRGMRWHPLMIHWCFLYLQHQSSVAYKSLRNSGCLVLPSQHTLRDYTHFVIAAPGFSAEVDQQPMVSAGINKLGVAEVHTLASR